MKISEWIKKDNNTICCKVVIPEQSVIMPLPKTTRRNACSEFFKYYQNCFSQKVYMLNLFNARVGGADDGISGPGIITCDDVILEDLVPYAGDGCQGFSSKIRIMDGKGICMAQKWGGHNYGHWLFTSVPKLALCLKEGIEFDYIIHNAFCMSCIKQSFELIGIKKEVVELRLFPHLLCKNLTIPSFIGNFVNPNRTAVHLIRWLFSKYLCPSAGKRILLKRLHSRRIINCNEVEQILIKKGFEIIRPENLTFLEQIQLFSKADIIVGNGSGLTNTVFCNKGTKVLDFDSPTFLDLFHWYHANSNDLDFYQITGDPLLPIPPPATDLGSYYKCNGSKDFMININELNEILNIMGI
jgi:hypothetical protein